MNTNQPRCATCKYWGFQNKGEGKFPSREANVSHGWDAPCGRVMEMRRMVEMRVEADGYVDTDGQPCLLDVDASTFEFYTPPSFGCTFHAPVFWASQSDGETI